MALQLIQRHGHCPLVDWIGIGGSADYGAIDHVVWADHRIEGVHLLDCLFVQVLGPLDFIHLIAAAFWQDKVDFFIPVTVKIDALRSQCSGLLLAHFSINRD